MSSAIEPVQPRDEQGHWLPGQTANVDGLNQYSPGHMLKRRLDAAIANAVTQRPECITSFAEKFADALANPEDHLQFLYLCKDRIAALLPADGDAAGDDPVAARTSEAD